MVEEKVKDFFAGLGKTETRSLKLYNEAGLQYQLALYLGKELKEEAEILLEYPVTKLEPKATNFNFIKKEIDIFINHKGENPERVVIELKFPRSNAGFPGQIYAAAKDVKFGEQIIDQGKADRFITIFITDHKSVGNKNTNHIYELFNSNPPSIKTIKIGDNYPKFMRDHKEGRYKPIEFKKEFSFKWKDLSHNDEAFQYYIITKSIVL